MTEPVFADSNIATSPISDSEVVDNSPGENAGSHEQNELPAEAEIGSSMQKETKTLAVQTVRGRTLVLCFDGTAGQYDNSNSNVVKLSSLLTKDPAEQLCYYQPGVGTYFKPGIVSPLLLWGARTLDLGIAWYLNEHVLDGYKFIMQNYSHGDKICLFGFSRGAYTARALAGMLHKVGLLPRDNHAQMPFAFKLYKREDQAGLNLCAGFKRTYCHRVTVEFVGVWDTVASVGALMGRTLPFTNSNSSIRTFRHALALDEHRARYRPNMWHRAPPKVKAPVFSRNVEAPPEHVLPPRQNSESSSSSEEEVVSKPQKRMNIFKRAFTTAGTDPEKAAYASVRDDKGRIPRNATDGSNDVLEVWFSGCHSDVGGGAVQNGAKHSLSYITLRWMVRQAASTGSGVKFNLEALARAGIDIEDCAAQGPLDEMDKADLAEDVHDKLKKMPLWWILEIMPMTYVWQDKENKWHRSWKWHLGKGRTIHDHHPKLHETVRVRTLQKDDYKPKAKWEEGNETYVR
ncbi:hypothetical protein DFP72DRAFT_571848 [Ephemerocybe angulata]|uniref:T6SS Phospholipase effector Tle1-like catalytic domain-containing protein n=1 Tax=Ephemerocybe angulata TaxID=980116 RepID=A0A8H6LZB0_9AGAR|nr:hypothetical protein DFP72DRAFT_571848 [Tulosesus angulatus]